MEAVHTVASLGRKHESSVSGSNAVNALVDSQHGQTGGTVLLTGTVALDAEVVGIGVVSRKTVADLSSCAVVSEDSVVGSFAVSASVGSQGAGFTTGVASRAGKTAVSINDLEESGGADTLSVDKGSVVGSVAGKTGGG